MNLSKKKIFVSGADGFIGSHLTEKLVSLGAKVTALSHYNSFNHLGWLGSLPSSIFDSLDIVSGDIRDHQFVADVLKGADVVFHLASLIAIPYSYQAPQSYVETNILGTLNVLKACKQHGVEKIVHTSTSEVYGTALYTPIDEKHPLQGQSPYSASKIGADMMAESFYRSFELPVAIARPFNTYGPRQSARAVIPTIISQLLSGAKKIRLGALEPTRDFNFVADTVAGFMAIAESKQSVGRVLNIGSGVELSIGNLFEKLCKITGASCEIARDEKRLRPKNSEVHQLICDATALGKLTGWQPKYSLDEGLTLTVQWTRENLHHFTPEKYTL